MQATKDGTVVRIVVFSNGFSVIGRVRADITFTVPEQSVDIIEPMMVSVNQSGKMSMDAMLSYSSNKKITVLPSNVITAYDADNELASYYDEYNKIHKEFILPLLKAGMADSVTELKKTYENMVASRAAAH